MDVTEAETVVFRADELPLRGASGPASPRTVVKVCPGCGQRHLSSDNYPGGGRYCCGDCCGHHPAAARCEHGTDTSKVDCIHCTAVRYHDELAHAGMDLHPKDLVGLTVLYETDGRGGKRYVLPAVVTCVQESHPDLPFLRAAEEAAGPIGDRADKCFGLMEKWGEMAESGVRPARRGWLVGSNPVPIPLERTAHLKVLTPGPQGTYDEFSVPYDHTGATPRSWRHHPSTLPF